MCDRLVLHVHVVRTVQYMTGTVRTKVGTVRTKVSTSTVRVRTKGGRFGRELIVLLQSAMRLALFGLLTVLAGCTCLTTFGPIHRSEKILGKQHRRHQPLMALDATPTALIADTPLPSFLQDPVVRNFVPVTVFSAFKIIGEVQGENRVDAKGWAVWLSIAYGFTAAFTYRMLNPIIPPADAAEVPAMLAHMSCLMESSLLDGSTATALAGGFTDVESSSWQLVAPFDATDNSLDGKLLARDLFLIYIYGHVPAFAWLGYYYNKNKTLKNAWPPTFEKI